MATVVYSNEEDGMCSFVIDGEEYVEDEERAIIPKAVLKQIRVEDIPNNFEIEVCESKDSSVIMVSVPMTFAKIGKNEFQVIYDELITRKYWDGPIGLKLYMETKKDVIEERSKEVGDVYLENHDIEVVFSDTVTEEDIDAVKDAAGAGITGSVPLYKNSVEYHTDSAVKTVYIVAAEPDSLDAYMHFELLEGEGTYPGDGEIFLSQKIAEIADVHAGDSITLTDSDAGEVTLTIAGIYENYVWHYAYMTPETYADYFGKTYEPNTMYVNTNDDETAFSAGAKLRKMDGVMNVTVVPEMKERVENMMSMMNAVVWLVIGSAGALAFIVLFNLSNINITERQREIATIKVLGFYPRETGAYVFRENLVLTLMGIVVGLPLGVWLHRFVMNQIQVDMVAFKVAIMPVSYLLSVVIVLLFLKVVDLVMRRKIDRIDMTESLKSIE